MTAQHPLAIAFFLAFVLVLYVLLDAVDGFRRRKRKRQHPPVDGVPKGKG